MKERFSPILSSVTKFYQDEMSVYAAQASFFILLAAFPFLMLLLALIDLIPVVQQSDLLILLVDLMPDHLDSLVLTVIDDIQTSSSPALLSASAVTSVWSASKGMLGIERGLNRAYDVHVQRNYFVRRLLCNCYTLFFSLMCTFSLLLRFSAFFILWLFFLAFYMVLPHKKQKLRSQIPGALFSALGWIFFSIAYSLYFQYWGRFTVTYGSLTAVLFLMLWLYFCICILFLGAEINHALVRYGK